MEDEIKEILEDYGCIPRIKKLGDYITNLQEEIEKLNNDKRGMLVELYKANDEIEKYEKVINEIKEKIDDYFGYDYKNESQARLDTINEINHIIVDLYNGGDEE